MSVCPFCHQDVKNLAAHKNHCWLNPKRDEIRKKMTEGMKATRKANEDKKRQSPYYQEQKSHKLVCENCGTEFEKVCSDYDFDHIVLRFCSKECARSYSTKRLKGQTKMVECMECHEMFEIPKRSGRKICKKCQENIGQTSKSVHQDDDNSSPILRRSSSISRVMKDYCQYLDRQCLNDDCYFRQIGFCKQRFGITQRFLNLDKYLHFSENAKGNYEILVDDFKRMKKDVQSLIDEGLTPGEICLELTGSMKKGNTIFESLGIKTRNLSEAVKNSLLRGKLRLPEIVAGMNFKSEHHRSWNGEVYFLRSGHETSFASELDRRHILYEVEKLRLEYYDTQMQKMRIAIPDFYLPETNEIVEVKTAYTLNVQNMKDKFEEYKRQGYTPILWYENHLEDLYSLEQPKKYMRFKEECM